MDPRRPVRPRPPSAGRAAGSSDSLPRWVQEELRATAGPARADAAIRAMAAAVALLEEGKDGASMEAARRAKAMASRSAAVRELMGIAAYRAERFRDALRELQAYRRLSGRLDQNHLIADCHRALGAPEKAVEAATEALHADLPTPVRAEAAVVGAAALADMGRFGEAVGILRSFPAEDARAEPHHLRLWYVTGDVLARAGRPADAAEEFRRVLRHDPEAFDAAERLAALE